MRGVRCASVDLTEQLTKILVLAPSRQADAERHTSELFGAVKVSAVLEAVVESVQKDEGLALVEVKRFGHVVLNGVVGVVPFVE